MSDKNSTGNDIKPLDDTQPRPATRATATQTVSPPAPAGTRVPNLKWALATLLFSGAIALFLAFGTNWTAPETYIALGGFGVIIAGSIVAISSEKRGKTILGKAHGGFFLYGIGLLLGAGLAGVAFGAGNILVPNVFPFSLVPIAFYGLAVTAILLAVEFGISIVKNYR